MSDLQHRHQQLSQANGLSLPLNPSFPLSTPHTLSLLLFQSSSSALPDASSRPSHKLLPFRKTPEEQADSPVHELTVGLAGRGRQHSASNTGVSEQKQHWGKPQPPGWL